MHRHITLQAFTIATQFHNLVMKFSWKELLTPNPFSNTAQPMIKNNNSLISSLGLVNTEKKNIPAIWYNYRMIKLLELSLLL